MTKLTLKGFAAQSASKLAARKRVFNLKQILQIKEGGKLARGPKKV